MQKTYIDSEADCMLEHLKICVELIIIMTGAEVLTLYI